MKLKGTGRIIFWPGGSLWMGLAKGGSELHAHHAIQIAFGVERPISLRPDPNGDWMEFFGAIIAPDLSHEYLANGGLVANLFLEPESRLGRLLLDRFGDHAISALDPAFARSILTDLVRLFSEDAEDDRLIQETMRIFSGLAGLAAPNRPTDPRILRIIDWIYDHIDGPLTLGAAADVACLSESRLRHLFVAETGVAFRPFVLWARVKRAVELGFAGASWTDAAMGANFADQAHLTRTCRRMFGLVPSALSPGSGALLARMQA